MNSIEKAMEKKNGEVTASTVLEQCIRMSNDKIYAFFEFQPHVNGYYISVRNGSKDGLSEPIYFNKHWINQKSASLAEIYQDLIKIEVEQGDEKK